MPKKKPWYHEGLAFECTGCGACCTGDPGYVFADEGEIRALAKHLGLSVAAFKDACMIQVGSRWSLKELTGGDCIFFDRVHRRCTVYDLRPTQCRTWPFWKSNLVTAEHWEATCRACPGCGRSQLFTREEIEEMAGRVRV